MARWGQRALPCNSLSNAQGQVGRLVLKPPQGDFMFHFYGALGARRSTYDLSNPIGKTCPQTAAKDSFPLILPFAVILPFIQCFLSSKAFPFNDLGDFSDGLYENGRDRSGFYSSRKAIAMGRRAARIAGGRPPMNPTTMAQSRP